MHMCILCICLVFTDQVTYLFQPYFLKVHSHLVARPGHTQAFCLGINFFCPTISNTEKTHTLHGVLKQYTSLPSKNTLARSYKKRPFFYSCKILRDLVGFCRNFAGRNLAQNSCKIPAKSHKISLDLAGMQEKRTFSCKILQEHFYWYPGHNKISDEAHQLHKL